MDINKLYHSMLTESDDDVIEKVINYEDCEYDPYDDYYDRVSAYGSRSEEDDAFKYDMVSLYKSTLLLAAHARRYNVIKMLLDLEYAKPYYAEPSIKMTALHIISSTTNLDYLTLYAITNEYDLKLIEEYVASANSMELNSSVILAITREVLKGNKNLTDNDIKMLAEKINNEELQIAKLLLDMGARVDDKDVYGSSAVYRAAMSRKYDMIELLLDHGASVGIVEDVGICHFEAEESIVSHIVLKCFSCQSEQHKNIGRIIDSSSRLKKIKIACEKELDAINSIKLNSKHTLLAFLYKDTASMSKLVNNPAICVLDKYDFKIYGDRLQRAIKAASYRQSSVESSVVKIDETLRDSSWKSVPIEVRYSIIELLEDKDLNLIINS
ncbi:CNPV026 ankyrin repeat protein [Canarypox virus]|uniref:CNPV026 ankyrin repeat protein n=1 Tax=Canarypox virus TaxID=44088 RepID=Q6VZX1_CNPV|nr:CNPV026 ankyrin repeat protein [Canarypox virus]AAR83372.1 CNPV026 ankyrin repeat protein [Canarypox virus]AWD84502.1 ankyrin repeat protein [Canarypox virus]